MLEIHKKKKKYRFKKIITKNFTSWYIEIIDNHLVHNNRGTPKKINMLAKIF